MTLQNFSKALTRYQESLDIIKGVEKPKEVNFSNFKEGKAAAVYAQYHSNLEQLKKYAPDVLKSFPSSKDGFLLMQRFEELVANLESAHNKADQVQEQKIIISIADMLVDIEPLVTQKQEGLYKIQNIPDPIKPEILADIAELEKCFNADCLRSCVIICGRLLETTLHRKYFESTGQDILEKNPGIGLGTLVAKLTEKGILLDPGLNNLIHLINNVRIFTVHKKKEAFYPSKEQTQATMLFTLDVVRKLFSR